MEERAGERRRDFSGKPLSPTLSPLLRRGERETKLQWQYQNASDKMSDGSWEKEVNG
jgi:hypothetical protein